MNKTNSSSSSSTSGKSFAPCSPLHAARLYASPPDAVQRLHPDYNPRSGKAYADPTTYTHAWPSMGDYARLLALRYEALRTRHSYYRDMRLLADHFSCDPAALNEAQVTDYLLHVKFNKGWQPKTVRQTAAAARLFYHDLLKKKMPGKQCLPFHTSPPPSPP